ncbi:Heavy metal-associated isoprenylated plant protein 26 [Apostasia shenzhenica]|uniref:Heavy metal-associated isoprenylated plant protein 26 n=1 Tax=Apostasia shenzhenica TaxID=1088818 RepID=A0A2I0B657_9ASPA|nr:Heavy metal-associated isoprenylated plant protein 26 [Apostasia shenzhenica]
MPFSTKSLKPMASLLFKDTKGSNLSCASPASAAVCTSIERRSMVRPSIGRAADIHRRDNTRRSRVSNPIYQIPLTPNPCDQSSRMSSENQSIDSSSPAGSSRCLLNSNPCSNVIPELDSSRDTVPAESDCSHNAIEKKGEIEDLDSSYAEGKEIQVVVLRVSLHCKGCEGKVRKHISKMKGVTSFNIDMAKKKVTVVGNVTRLGVLSSISKVRNAQFWPSPPRISASF